MSRRSEQLSFQDLRLRSGRGGPRPGAGRPPGARPRVHHVKRPAVRRDHPSHVTLRVREGIPSLRKRSFVGAFSRTLANGCERGNFRVVHYSVQRDHVHLIVESAGKRALGCGMKSVGIRLARAVNRVFGRRGPVLDGRYHLRALRTPREVRNAIAYVLLNARKHWRQRFGRAPHARIDEASSGHWFDGWKRDVEPGGAGPPPVSGAHTWLLAKGWRRHGLIDPVEVPGERARLVVGR